MAAIARGIPLAREKQAEIIPRLILSIDAATEDVDEFGKVRTWGHIAALFLQMEFEAGESFPTILKSICTESVDELYDDFVTENFPLIVATLAASSDDFAAAIDDRNVNDYVRGSLVGAVFGMVCEGRISREQAIPFLCNRLSAAVDSHDSHIGFCAK